MSVLQNFSGWLFWLSRVEEGKASSSCRGEKRLNTYSSVGQCKSLSRSSSGAQAAFLSLPLPVWELEHTARKKGPLSFSPIGKWLIERWVGRKWALENPLCFLARCLPGLWAVRELIYKLSGKLGKLTKRALPPDRGTGSPKGNKSLPRRRFWPQSAADARAAGPGLLFLFCVEQKAATAVAFNLGVAKGGRRAGMFLPCLRGVTSC